MIFFCIDELLCRFLLLVVRHETYLIPVSVIERSAQPEMGIFNLEKTMGFIAAVMFIYIAYRSVRFGWTYGTQFRLHTEDVRRQNKAAKIANRKRKDGE